MNNQAAESPAAATPALVSLLVGISDWHSSHVEDVAGALSLVEEEERGVRATLLEAQRRQAALASLRREQQERLAEVEAENLRRKRAAVRGALATDRALLELRAAALLKSERRRDVGLAAGMDRPEVAEAVAAFLRVRDEPAAGHPALSAPQRRAIEPFLRAAESPPLPLPEAPVGVGVVVSASPPGGRPEALVVVLPVPWAVYADGTTRPEDLCTALGYRMVGGVCGLLGELGAGDAPVRYTDLDGNLAIQVWLGDHPIAGDLREIALERIGAAADGSAELEAAKVEIYALWLSPELLAEGD